MPVSIPISASPDGVTAALRQIEDAIKRAGQQGTEFSKLDLSHPELRNLATEIQRVQQRFEDLSRIGRGATATAVRAMQRQGGVVDPLSWEFASNRTFSDETERRRHQASVGSYLFQGTRWERQQNAAQPAAAPSGGGGGGGGGLTAGPRPVGSGGGGGGDGGGGGGGMLAGALGRIGPFFLASLAMAGLSSVKQVVGASIGKAQGEATENENLLRHTDEATTDFDALRESVRKTTTGLQLTYQETQRLSLAWAKLTNDSSPEAISAGVRLGTGFARAYGIDPGTGVQALGAASYQGMDQNKFALLIGEAVKAGGQTGQVEQVMQSLLHWSENATRSLVTHSNEREFASMYAGMNAMDVPGLHGTNAAGVIDTLNASLSKGGNAGPASGALTYRAMQREGVTDPYDIKMLTEGGMFATPKQDLGYGSNTSVFESTMGELRREYAGQPQNRLLDAMENHFGTNMRMNRELLRYKPADLTRAQGALDDAHMNLKDINPMAIKSIVDVSSPDADLNAWRTKLLGRHGTGALSADEQAKLRDTAPGDLRTELVRLLGQHGTESTEGSETRASMATLSNAMTKIGADLLKPLNDLKDISGQALGMLGDLGSILTNIYKAGEGDPKAKERLLDQLDAGDVGKAMMGDTAAQARLGGAVGSNEPNLSDAVKKSRAAQAVAYFQTPEGGGWTRAQALGIATQAGAESGWQAHGPAGDGGLAKGAFQWHPDRQAAIERHFGKKIDDMSWEEQMQAKAWELSAGGPEAAAGDALRKTTTAWGAGYSETVNDERPDYKQLKGVSRGAYAASLDYSVGSGNAGAPATVQIAPLEVIHRDAAGSVTHTQTLPVTTVTLPQSWGPPPPGMADHPPPSPPVPVMVPAGQAMHGPLRLAPLQHAVQY